MVGKVSGLVRVFVYGTLKPGEINYLPYCAGKVTEIVRAYTFGQLFALPVGYPAMTPGQGRVEGFLLTFNDAALLTQLDELEDYDPHRTPEENEYNRELIWVYSLCGEGLGQAWGYLMSEEQALRWGGILLPSGWWSAQS